MKKRYILQIFLLLISSLVYSFYGVYMISFINSNLLESPNYKVLVLFYMILIGFLIVGVLSKAVMAKVSNETIFTLRLKLVAGILNSTFIDILKTGKAKILASLSKDISAVTDGFLRISDIVQSGAFILLSVLYFYYLSPIIASFIAVWFIVVFIIQSFLIKKSYIYYKESRGYEDGIYKEYEKGLLGHKELKISSKKQLYFYESFKKIANLQKISTQKAQIYQAILTNFLNTALLGAIGGVMGIAFGFGVVEFKTATTISIALLFLRTPFIMFISSLPSVLVAFISLKKILNLNLDLNSPPPKLNKKLKWSSIKLKNIKFSYDEKQILNGINLEIKKGETIFLVGENGAGKSTLFMILAGILTPSSGEILVDDNPLNEENLGSFRESISVVFSEFYIFREILSLDDKEYEFWVEILRLKDRVEIVSGEVAKFKDLNLSTGQRKRVALLVVLLENSDFLLLDEWAADQDPEFRRYFYEEILAILKKRGVSVFAISHDDRYFQNADKVYKIFDGKLTFLMENLLKFRYNFKQF